jgi:hypothetical protein
VTGRDAPARWVSRLAATGAVVAFPAYVAFTHQAAVRHALGPVPWRLLTVIVACWLSLVWLYLLASLTLLVASRYTRAGQAFMARLDYWRVRNAPPPPTGPPCPLCGSPSRLAEPELAEKAV